jgi:hypothetical protein
MYGVLEQILHLHLFGGTAGAGTYDINTAGQAFSFSESYTAADSVVTSQSAASGTIASPNLYSNSTTQLGGDKGTLAGTLSGYWCSYRHCWWFWYYCYWSKNHRIECI